MTFKESKVNSMIDQFNIIMSKHNHRDKDDSMTRFQGIRINQLEEKIRRLNKEKARLVIINSELNKKLDTFNLFK
jgi:hypothetical protein